METLNTQHRTSNIEGGAQLPGGRKYNLEERLLNYAARIIRLAESLPATRTGNHVAGQLLRSGTSPLPNHGEAQAAESPADFVHKLKICLKELRETKRWLRLVQMAVLVKNPEKIQPLVEETEELIRIFVASIKTSETKQSRGRTARSRLDVQC